MMCISSWALCNSHAVPVAFDPHPAKTPRCCCLASEVQFQNVGPPLSARGSQKSATCSRLLFSHYFRLSVGTAGLHCQLPRAREPASKQGAIHTGIRHGDALGARGRDAKTWVLCLSRRTTMAGSSVRLFVNNSDTDIHKQLLLLPRGYAAQFS